MLTANTDNDGVIAIDEQPIHQAPDARIEAYTNGYRSVKSDFH
jgi:hypothetical protein